MSAGDNTVGRACPWTCARTWAKAQRGEGHRGGYMRSEDAEACSVNANGREGGFWRAGMGGTVQFCKFWRRRARNETEEEGASCIK